MVAASHNGQRVGYVRVSSLDQHTDRQLDGVQLDEIFEDKASGKDTHRPALQRALKHVRKGDVLVAHSIDRLARSLSDLLALVKELTGRGVTVEFVKERLTFTAGATDPMANFQLQLLGAVAEFERALIRERQREGIAIAKSKGKHLGRKAKLTKAQAKELRSRIAAGADRGQIAEEFGISRSSTYSYTA